MKKNIFLSGLIFSLGLTILSQELNQTFFSDKTNSVILIGYCNRDAFTNPEFQYWFEETYENYTPDITTMDELSNIDLFPFAIKIIMGTWCSDSQREVPGFYRILDDLAFPEYKITLINVNRIKEVPGLDISDLNIEKVPTFIFHKNGKEIGRIIEAPVENLEKDMLKIISQ